MESVKHVPWEPDTIPLLFDVLVSAKSIKYLPMELANVLQVSTESAVYAKNALQILTLALLWEDVCNIVPVLMKCTKEAIVSVFLVLIELTECVQSVLPILFITL